MLTKKINSGNRFLMLILIWLALIKDRDVVTLVDDDDLRVHLQQTQKTIEKKTPKKSMSQMLHFYSLYP